MRKKVNPRDWGVSAPRGSVEVVPPLGPPPEKVKQVVRKYEKAWRAWDATMVVSDKDRVLADRVFDAARKQENEDGKDEGS